MHIVLGLGNTGKKYEHTRHNVGFMVLDAYAHAEALSFEERPIFHASIALSDSSLLLAKPTTYMNESGRAAALLAKQYEGMMVVVYDDIDISLGEVKCSFGRGSGGHNGVASVIEHLGHKDFFRIRVGVRPVHEELRTRILPPNGFETFLLSDFAPFEKELKEKGIATAVAIIRALPTTTIEQIMTEYN